MKLTGLTAYQSAIASYAKQHAWMLCMTCLCYAAAYGYLAFNSTLAGDEWPFYYGGESVVRFPIQSGRWVHYASLLVMREFWPAFTVTIFVFLGLLLLSLLILAHELGLKRAGAVWALFVIGGTMPFWAEMVNFRNNHVGIGIGLVAATLSGVSLWRSFVAWQAGSKFISGSVCGRMALGSLLFSLAAASYQALLAISVMVPSLMLLQRVLRQVPPVQRYQDFLKIFGLLGLFVLFGALAYILQVKAALEITGIPPSKQANYQLSGSLVSSVDELRMTLERAAKFIKVFLFNQHHLFSGWTKALFAASILCLITLCLRCAWASNHRLISLLTIALALICLVGAPWALGVVRVPPSYRYNALVSNALLYGGVLALLIEHLRNPRLVRAATLAALIMGFVFIASQNNAAQITEANNLRDRALANRILLRIEMHPEYALLSKTEMVKIIIQGRPPLSRSRPFKTKDAAPALSSSIIECDVSSCQINNLTWLLRGLQASEVNFQMTSVTWLDPDQYAEVQPALREMSDWPAPGSLKIFDPTTILIRYSAMH